MADLPSGSTFGGERIIHKAIENKHRHDASQIEDLNPLLYSEEGSGGGIDADVLSGYTYTELSTQFLQVRNDSIESLVLNSHPTTNNNAASLLYLKNSVPNNLKSGNFYGITSIGDQRTSTYNYSIIDNYTVRIESMDVLINGAKYTLPTSNVDVRILGSNFQNKIFYFYIRVLSGNVSIFLLNEKVDNTEDMIYIGVAETNGSQVISYSPIENEQRVGVGSYMLSETPKRYSIVASKDDGTIDSNWAFGLKGEGLVNVSGPTTIQARQQYTYNISNYNSFSQYDVSIDSGIATIISVNEEIITIETPSINPFEGTVNLSITRDGINNDFPITLEADPSITLSGPSNISSGNTYQYQIGNYIENYNETTTSDIDGLTFSITGDILTVTTNNTNPYTQSGIITIQRDGSSYDLNITYDADPQISITGPDQVSPGGEYNFEIQNYNPGYSYNISTTLGTVFRSDNIIVLSTQNIASTESSQNITISADRTNSSASIVTYYQSSYILNFPEDYDPNYDTSSNGIPLAELFEQKYGIGTREILWYYGVYPQYGPLELPVGIYEINIQPRDDILLIYRENGSGGDHGLVFDFRGFHTDSDVQVNVSGDVVGRGGDAGGLFDWDLKTRGQPSNPQDGGDAIHITTDWASNPRNKPIVIDVSQANLYPGGGGGDSAWKIVISSDSRSYVNPDGSFIYNREGVISGAVGGDSAKSVPNGLTAPATYRDTTQQPTSYATTIDYVVQPDFINPGRIRHYTSGHFEWNIHVGSLGGYVGEGSRSGMFALLGVYYEKNTAEGKYTTMKNYSRTGYYSNGNPSGTATNYYQQSTNGGVEINVTRDGLQGYTIIQ